MFETELTDGIVTLRPVRKQDAESIYQAVHESLSELKPWMDWAYDGYSREAVDDFIQMNRAGWEEKTEYGFAIIDARNGDFVGVCGLNHLHPVYHLCNLGYWVRTSRHGTGLAGRAALLAARYGFEHGGIIRAEIVMAVGNEKSRRVAEKIGAHYEGILLNRMVIGKVIADAHMYSIIPQDFGIEARL
jgi:ribosomal-protein-serine acetyltransferase